VYLPCGQQSLWLALQVDATKLGGSYHAAAALQQLAPLLLVAPFPQLGKCCLAATPIEGHLPCGQQSLRLAPQTDAMELGGSWHTVVAPQRLFPLLLLAAPHLGKCLPLALQPAASGADVLATLPVVPT